MKEMMEIDILKNTIGKEAKKVMETGEPSVVDTKLTFLDIPYNLLNIAFGVNTRTTLSVSPTVYNDLAIIRRAVEAVSDEHKYVEYVYIFPETLEYLIDACKSHKESAAYLDKNLQCDLYLKKVEDGKNEPAYKRCSRYAIYKFKAIEFIDPEMNHKIFADEPAYTCIRTFAFILMLHKHKLSLYNDQIIKMAKDYGYVPSVSLTENVKEEK